MLYGSGGIDLIAARRTLDKYVKGKRPKRRWIPVLVVYALALLGAAGYLAWENMRVQGNINEINEFLQQEDVVQRRTELETLTQETIVYRAATGQVEYKAGWEATVPAAASHMMDFILFTHGVEGVEVQNFNFDERTGVVRVSATAQNARISSDYVDMLYHAGIAANVLYTGYGTVGEGLFGFTIDITLTVGGAY
jgi:hypothetical protein